MSSIIVADTKTVKTVLGEKYAVDFYQREYKWGTKQVAELVDDLVDAFTPQWKPEHERKAVRGYRGYFLGSIIVSERDGVRYIVDGQQRLTTLTLLLLSLLNRVGQEQRGQLAGLVYSLDCGEMKFNLDIQEREACLAALYEGKSLDEKGQPESVRGLLRRHHEIDELVGGLKVRTGEDGQNVSAFPFPGFSDWLIGRVCLAEIKATSDEDAYTVFETMNDRGLSLTSTEMLKGYLLAKIGDTDVRNRAGDVWKRGVGALVDYGKEEESDAIKAWLRGRHAQSIRDRKRNASPEDFDRIGSEFHRWVRDKKSALGLGTDQGLMRFITGEFQYYSGWYLRLRQAADKIGDARQCGLEDVYHNAESNFTLQYPVLLSSLAPNEPDPDALPKTRVVSAYLDILIHRRIWSGSAIDYSTMAYAMFQMMRGLRNKDAGEIADFLGGRLADPSLSAPLFSTNPRFRLHGNNKPKVRRILARMVSYLGEKAGVVSHYEDCAKCEIEHIWADKYEEHGHTVEFDGDPDFQEFRNRIGGLLLLPKGVNASVNDEPYKPYVDQNGKEWPGKLGVYRDQNQNLLAKSLHERCYESRAGNAGFLRFKEESGLPFKAHPNFKKGDLEERQALYLQLAERIWSPGRLREAAES